MKTIALTALFTVTAITACALASSPDASPPPPEPPGSIEIPSRPDHLEPIFPYDDYHGLAYRKLVESNPCFWMLSLGGRERAVSVIEIFDKNHQRTDSFAVIYSETEEPIWNWNESPSADGYLQLDLRRDAKVKKWSTPITSEVAKMVIRAGEAVLRHTRYAERRDVGMDGTTYEFFVRGWMGAFVGRTWSPEGGDPMRMVKLGNALTDLARSDVDVRSKAEQAVIEECREILDVRRKESAEEDGGYPP
jgi:hypothetical protein